MQKNQKPNQVTDPWYILAVPTGKTEFGAPNCPVKALKYYHRYMTEHPEERAGATYLSLLRTTMWATSSLQPRFLGIYAPP